MICAARRLFSTSGSKCMAAANNNKKSIDRVTVIGAGLMGSGIAQVAAQNGFRVTLVDTSRETLTKGENIIKKSLARVAKKRFEKDPADQQTAKSEKFINDTLGHIAMSTDAMDAVKSSDLVIEAIVENLGVKRQLFRDLDRCAPEHTIFTSNTSSLPIAEIASSTGRQDRFGGLHFFNPVPQMKLVEVVETDALSEQSLQALVEFSRQLKKAPVKCKDTPGFVVNRLLVPYIMEAMRMADRKDASIEDIDTAMKLGAGFPMGPFELADFVGLDTLKFITDGWFKDGKGVSGSPLVEPVECLNRLVAQGKLGRKSGQGFYDYRTNAGNSKL